MQTLLTQIRLVTSSVWSESISWLDMKSKDIKRSILGKNKSSDEIVWIRRLISIGSFCIWHVTSFANIGFTKLFSNGKNQYISLLTSTTIEVRWQEKVTCDLKLICKDWDQSAFKVNPFGACSVLECYTSRADLGQTRNACSATWASSWKNLFMPYATNKGADQPVHPRNLISTFVVRCQGSTILLLAKCKISRLCLVSVVESLSSCKP